jgi:enoyl-CoA hydratase/carnithine racemase
VKGSIEAIKRGVYFGGSMSLELGLRMEHIEFLGMAKSKDGQELMID